MVLNNRSIYLGGRATHVSNPNKYGGKMYGFLKKGVGAKTLISERGGHLPSIIWHDASFMYETSLLKPFLCVVG